MTDLLERNYFWQKGPEFLLKDKSAWPKQPSMKESVESSAVSPPVDNITDEIKIYAAQAQALEEQKGIGRIQGSNPSRSDRHQEFA